MAEAMALEWLEYSGQHVGELLAGEGKYRADSLVCAFEWGLQAKQSAGGELTEEERTVLAVQAIEREVNNGGYDQFFVNSSHVFAPIAVDALKRIGCPETAELTRRAIDALGLEEVTPEAVQAVIFEENADRDEALNGCDNEYYQAVEPIADRLFEFIKLNAGQFNF